MRRMSILAEGLFDVITHHPAGVVAFGFNQEIREIKALGFRIATTKIPLFKKDGTIGTAYRYRLSTSGEVVNG